MHPILKGGYRSYHDFFVMADKRILYVAQEMHPFLPETPNSKLGCELPRYSHDNGYEVRTFMPKFGSINERRNQLHEVIRLSRVNISINDADHPLIIKVTSLQPSRIQVYFIDNDDYFQRSADDVNPVGTNRADNDERAIFFTRGTMETVNKLRWEPSVVHCQGWMTGLAPLYIKRLYQDNPTFRESKIVYNCLPGEMPETLDANILGKLEADGIPAEDLAEFKDMPVDGNLFHRIAIKFSDGVIFPSADVDPQLVEYARSRNIPVMTYEQKEITTEDYIQFHNTIVEHE